MTIEQLTDSEAAVAAALRMLSLQHRDRRISEENKAKIQGLLLRGGISEITVVPVERKSFKATAVQITSGNMLAVANWSGARILVSEDGVLLEQPSSSPLSSKKTVTAGIGDWVVNKDGFKIYRDPAFLKTFDILGGIDDRFEKILQLVKRAMNEPVIEVYHRTSAEMNDTAIEIATKIFEL